MAKLWAGLESGKINKIAEEFNSSIGFDSRMYEEDIKGSIAHAAMLCKCNYLTEDEFALINSGLACILDDIKSGNIKIDETAEDIHTFVEELLTGRIGETGKKLHTARSRNDQVALDLRLYLKGECDAEIALLKELIGAICEKAEEYKNTVCPGYTHLQRAQPITFGHHLMAYAFMLMRDVERLSDCKKRMDVSPIGSCALAGTTYNTDRFFEAEKLGFSDVCRNSIDGVSDRDFAVELISCNAIIMTHLSRFSEEIILWSSAEFGYVKLSSDYTTGSSIMPQKRNPDMAELVRGKTGRVYGDLISLLTTLKGLPLAYNKDMQEDKESVFDSSDTVKACLQVFAGMISSMTANKEKMLSAAKKGFLNATDLADYLVGKGIPFRDAYKLSGKIVAECIKENCSLEDFPIEKYKKHSEKIAEDVYPALSIETCVNKRKSFGGTGGNSVEMQIEYIKEKLK